LTQPAAGEAGREYLKNRGVTQESIKVFQLGYALPSWDGLLQYLNGKKKYSIADLEKAGLIVKGKNNRYYDRFRDRLMFPLRNHRGQVVGFSGRCLDPEAKEAKYINSPETSLYHKSELLFGFSELFHEIKKHQQVIVMEGEFDLISSTQAHVNQVVAIKGSALTEAQIKLLGRVATQVLLALDADDAGIKATQRAIELIAQTSLELRVIDFGHSEELKAAGLHGKDPDEIARTNPKLWRTLTEQSVSAYEFLLRASLEKHDPTSAEGRKHIIDELAPVFGRISHAVEQDFYVQKLATALNVRAELVAKDLAKFAHGKAPGQTYIAAKPAAATPQISLSRRRQLEQYLLYLCLHSPADQVAARAQQLTELSWEEPTAKTVLASLTQATKQFDVGVFTQNLATDLQTQVFNWYLNPQFETLAESSDDEQEWPKQLAELKKLVIQAELQKIQQRIKVLDAKQVKTPAEELEVTQLLEQIVVLQQQQKV
jgi:DNA primase